MSQIGFVLLTHMKPHQTLRLVRRLNSMFGNPPIACHHDFGKCPIPDGFLPDNVSFVRPHVDTAWATFSIVKATALGLEELYRRPDSPDWCMIISGSCYPTKPAAQILANLNSGGYDAHFNGLNLHRDALETELHRYYYSRYCTIEYTFRSLDKRLRPRMRRFRLPYFLENRLLPFRNGMRPFAGSNWFSLSRRASEYIIQFQKTQKAAALTKHYDGLFCPEESYFHTIVYSAPELKVHSDNWLYTDWSEKTFHPKQLTLDDLDALQASPTHFARKFDLDVHPDVLDALDLIIDGKQIIDGGASADKSASVQVGAVL